MSAFAFLAVLGLAGEVISQEAKPVEAAAPATASATTAALDDKVGFIATPRAAFQAD